MKKYFPNYPLLSLRKSLNEKQSSKLSDAFHQFFNKFIEPYEAISPNIVSDFPGIKAKDYNSHLKSVVQNGNIEREVINLNKSFGNYFVDIDGNTVLDMHMDNGRNILGYNHRRIIKDANLERYQNEVVQRQALGILPPIEYIDWTNDIMKVIGHGELNQIGFSCGCGAPSNENAIKLAFLKKLYELKGNDILTEEEQRSVLEGEAPGAPNFSCLSFDGGYYGKFLNALSISNVIGKPEITKSISRQDWPIAPFPKIKYPYEEFEIENRKEEQYCIEQAEKLIKDYKNYKPVACVIIEPLQLQSGVRYA
jgi:4-aminobutyrate aminotransferase/(S)-3-amino-2-methylpropionate transaminase